MSRTDGYWFPAKRYGYGWGLPGRWQGWLTLALYVVVVVGAGLVADHLTSVAGNVLAAVVLVVATGALLLVCARKGEPPGWRWGRRR